MLRRISLLMVICCLGGAGCSGSNAQSTSPAGNTTPQGSSGTSAALPTKITLQSVPMILDPAQVPPAPDPSVNDSTVAGVDSNGNGIRDDVERWIAATWPDSAKMRASMAQVSLSLQNYMTTSSTMTRDTAYQAALTGGNATSCLVSSRAATHSKNGWIKEIMVAQVNTKSRVNAYYDFQNALGSRLFKAPDDDKCDIPMSQLPN